MTLQTHSHRLARSLRRAFTLLEALITVAVMGALATLVIGSISNASRDAARMVGHQQHAALQSAVQAWIAGAAQTRDSATGQFRSMRDIRVIYNDSNPTSSARLNLIKGYLDDATFDHLVSSTTNNQRIKSEALLRAKQYLEFENWVDGDYPKVSLKDD